MACPAASGTCWAPVAQTCEKCGNAPLASSSIAAGWGTCAAVAAGTAGLPCTVLRPLRLRGFTRSDAFRPVACRYACSSFVYLACQTTLHFNNTHNNTADGQDKIFTRTQPHWTERSHNRWHHPYWSVSRVRRSITILIIQTTTFTALSSRHSHCESSPA